MADLSPKEYNVKSIHALIFLIIMTAFLFWVNHDIPFYYDDIRQILKNSSIQNGIDLTALVNDRLRASRFLMNLSFAVNWLISGSAPWSFHLFNNLFHAINTALLFTLLTRIGGRNTLATGFTCLLFFLHPLQAEGVSYIMGRTELLKTLITLALLHLYLRNDRPKWLIYFLLVIAILIKETCVLIPLMFIVLDFTVLKKTSKEISKKEHLFYLSHIIWLIPFHLIFQFDKTHESVVGFSIFPFWEYLWSNLYYLFFTVSLFINPTQQAFIHEYVINPPLLETLLGLILLVAIASTIILQWRKRPVLAFMLSFFLISYLPNNSVLQFINPYAEYRLYQSIIVLCWLVGTFLIDGTKHRIARLTVGGVLLVFALTFHVLYLGLWKNPLSLWGHANVAYPQSLNIAGTLSDELAKRGLCYEALRVWDRACLDSTDVCIHFQCLYLNTILETRIGDVAQAKKHLIEMLQLYQRYPYHAPEVREGIYLSHPASQAFYHNVVALAWDSKDQGLFQQVLQEARLKHPGMFANFSLQNLLPMEPCFDKPF